MSRPAALALAACLLSGCASLAPAYQRPAAPVPAAFPQGAPYAAARPGDLPEVDWNAVFGDPKLQALIRTALDQNRDLRAAVANVRAARAQVEVQRSQSLPTVEVQGAATIARTPRTAGGSGDTVSLLQAGLGVSAYELDLFGRLRSLSESAFEQYLATEEGRRAARISLIAGVADAYLSLAANRSLLAVSRRTQESGEQSLGLTRRRFEAGVDSQLAVSQAQTQVQQARANVAAYGIAAAQAKDALDLLVGAPVPESQTPAGLEEAAPGFAAVPAGLSSEVLLNRPDVLQAEHQLRAANAQIGAARAAFFPRISLTGQLGVASTSLSNLFSGGGAWSFMPSVSLPIFDGGRNRGALRYSQAQRDALTAAYEKAIQAAFRDVADALAASGGTVEQLQAQQALVAAAGEALTLSSARYERGSDSYLSLLDAQRSLYAAQQGLVLVQLSRTSSQVALYRALGGGAR